MASGACASTTEASANTPPSSQSQSHEIFLADEEISDVSLATFYVASVTSEPVAQTAEVAVKADGNIDGTRIK
jgi:hypothetical protein